MAALTNKEQILQKGSLLKVIRGYQDPFCYNRSISVRLYDPKSIRKHNNIIDINQNECMLFLGKCININAASGWNTSHLLCLWKDRKVLVAKSLFLNNRIVIIG